MAFPPDIIFSQLAISGVDPSGSRHLDLLPASGGNFVKNLSTNPGEFLDFGSLNLNAGKQETPTKAFRRDFIHIILSICSSHLRPNRRENSRGGRLHIHKRKL